MYKEVKYVMEQLHGNIQRSKFKDNQLDFL